MLQALSRYTEVFNEFIPSLKNIQHLLKHFPKDMRLHVERTLRRVTEDWESIQNNIQLLIQVSTSTENIFVLFIKNFALWTFLFHLWRIFHWFATEFSERKSFSNICRSGFQVLIMHGMLFRNFSQDFCVAIQSSADQYKAYQSSLPSLFS